MDLSKQKEFLDKLASKHSILESRDWESVTVGLLKLERAKVTILKSLSNKWKGLLVSYNGSILQALKTLYPNQEWEKVSCKIL